MYNERTVPEAILKPNGSGKFVSFRNRVSNPEAMPSPSSGAQTIELCTQIKPAALYSDSRLRTREGTARQGETLEILGRQARAWELRLRITESLAHNAPPPRRPSTQKARRLKQVCQLKQHQVAVPTQPEEDIHNLLKAKNRAYEKVKRKR